MEFAIKSEQLTKIYASQNVVENVNLRVPYGSVYGYLGANGAGKTTTIRMLLSLLKAHRGSIEILGYSLPGGFPFIAGRIGYVPGEIILYEELSGIEFLDYLQNFLGKKPSFRERLLSDFKLEKRDLTKKIRYYSQGMKQKLLLIQAMQHNPDLLIFDEPSEGLDPLIQGVLYNYISEFKEQGKTVFFSSHNLPEVEKICDHIGFVKDGRLLVQEKLADLKKRLPRIFKISFNEKINQEDFSTHSFEIMVLKEKELWLKLNGPMEPLMKILNRYKVYNIEMPSTVLEAFFMDYYK